MATVMLAMVIGQAVAIPLIIPFIIGAAIGGGIGYWLGMGKTEDYQKLKQEYEARLTSSTLQNDVNTRLYLQEIYLRDYNIISLGQDLLQYSRNFAWAIAKYTALKTLDYELTQNASDFITAKTIAKQKAHQAVYNFYVNVTRSVIANHNETVELLNYSLNYYMDNIKIKQIWFGVDPATATFLESIVFDPDGNNYEIDSGNIIQLSLLKLYVDKFQVTVLSKTFDVKRIWIYAKHGTTGHTVAILNVSFNHTYVVYNWTLYNTTLNQLDDEYNMINANIDAYIDGLAQDYVNNWNITKLIDPYILASLLNNAFNETGYYGYAAAELALLGLNTTGINKTIIITVYDGNTTTLEGWLFTDWQGTLETGKNYFADPAYKWFFVADGGIYDLTGYNFTVGTIRDWRGNELANVTLLRYVSHSGDVLRMYEELAMIRQLYEEYVNNLQAMAAGAGDNSFSLSAWWNSLDQTAKLGVIAVGAVGVYALLRRK